MPWLATTGERVSDSQSAEPTGLKTGVLTTGGLTAGVLWVGVGGAVGAVLRYLVVGLASHAGFVLPLGTLLVNVSGSMLIGLFAGYSVSQDAVAAESRLFFQTGLLGAFTTFSAFSLDTLILMQQGFWRIAIVNVLLNVLLCLAAVAIGFGIGGYLAR